MIYISVFQPGSKWTSRRELQILRGSQSCGGELGWMEFSWVWVAFWEWIGAKWIGAKCLNYKVEKSFSKTDIPAITLIVYSCISVKYRKYKTDTDDYSGVCLSMDGKGMNCTILCSERCVANSWRTPPHTESSHSMVHHGCIIFLSVQAPIHSRSCHISVMIYPWLTHSASCTDLINHLYHITLYITVTCYTSTTLLHVTPQPDCYMLQL